MAGPADIEHPGVRETERAAAENAEGEYQITVTIRDNLTGETETVSVGDDYLLICAGRAEMAGVQVYPGKGTHVITVKNAGSGRKKEGAP